MKLSKFVSIVSLTVGVLMSLCVVLLRGWGKGDKGEGSARQCCRLRVINRDALRVSRDAMNLTSHVIRNDINKNVNWLCSIQYNKSNQNSHYRCTLVILELSKIYCFLQLLLTNPKKSQNKAVTLLTVIVLICKKELSSISK